MKAKIKCEINCGECGGQMQYHENGKFVRCNTVKCSQRHVNYLAPTIDLIKEGEVSEKSKSSGKTKAAKN